MPKRPSNRSRRVTMTDVARRAGVSQPTVSFVLNGRDDVAVAEETRRRVLAAAAEMNFVPNRAAQLLRSNRSYLIGVVTNGIVSQPYAGRIVLGIQQVVQPENYLCLVIDTTDDPDQGDVAVANLLATGVSAIVYASPQPTALHRSRRLDDTRTLFVNCWPDQGQVETIILADEYHGGLAAAEAAFEIGHRRVAFLGGWEDEYACIERHRGFVDAALAAGIDPDTLPQHYGDYSISSGYGLTRQVLAEQALPGQPRPTAIVCGNDRMAIGSLLAVQSLGLDCPADVSVIGFDDQPHVADQVRPSLTTVELPHLLMGRRAGQLLLEEPDEDQHEVTTRLTIPAPLIRRDSLGPPPARRRRLRQPRRNVP